MKHKSKPKQQPKEDFSKKSRPAYQEGNISRATKKNNGWEKRLGTANLILTALIGIVFAGYLAYREERIQTLLANQQQEFQKELVRLQADTQASMSQAELEYSHLCFRPSKDCMSTFAITNTGPAAAKNVRVALAIEKFSEYSWKRAISNTDNVKVTVSPPSLEVDIQKSRIDFPQERRVPPSGLWLRFCNELLAGPGQV